VRGIGSGWGNGIGGLWINWKEEEERGGAIDWREGYWSGEEWIKWAE
jgi:hypothetical protein